MNNVSIEQFEECLNYGFDRKGLDNILQEVKVLTPIPVPCDILTQKVIYGIGKLRAKYNEESLSKSHNNDWDDKTSIQTHIEGVFGEYCYEVLSGTPMDKSIGRRNPYDFKHGNIEVDVKCSEKGNYLYVKKKRLIGHTHDEYWYTLVKGDPKKYTGEFVGCITGKEFFDICKPYPKNPESLSVRADQLRPMSELYDRLKKGGHLNGQGVWV
jgi:hypothetical protein